MIRVRNGKTAISSLPSCAGGAGPSGASAVRADPAEQGRRPGRVGAELQIYPSRLKKKISVRGAIPLTDSAAKTPAMRWSWDGSLGPAPPAILSDGCSCRVSPFRRRLPAFFLAAYISSYRRRPKSSIEGSTIAPSLLGISSRITKIIYLREVYRYGSRPGAQKKRRDPPRWRDPSGCYSIRLRPSSCSPRWWAARCTRLPTSRGTGSGRAFRPA